MSDQITSQDEAAMLATIVGEAFATYIGAIAVLWPNRIHGEENARKQIELLVRDGATYVPSLAQASLYLSREDSSHIPAGLSEFVSLLLAAWSLLASAQNEEELKTVLEQIPRHDEIAPLLTPEVRAWAKAAAV